LFPAPYTESRADEQGPEQGLNRASTGLSALRSLNRCLEVLQRRMFRLGRGYALTPWPAALSRGGRRRPTWRPYSRRFQPPGLLRARPTGPELLAGSRPLDRELVGVTRIRRH